MTATEKIELIKLISSIVGGAMAAYWAFFVWANARRKERELERTKQAMLYLNPFRIACEDLQSRLYNILVIDGLVPLRKRYPNGEYAEEIVYMIAQYFAWEWCIFRYSPYSKLIDLIENTRKAYATDTLLVGPFCFFRSEQKSLGSIARERQGDEFDVISLEDFKQELLVSPLKDFKPVQETISAVRKASTIDEVDPNVQKRMVRIQNCLVAIINYIEQEEGIKKDKNQRQLAK